LNNDPADYTNLLIRTTDDRLRTWKRWTADHRVIEWNGIPPDTVIKWNQSEVVLGHDAVLAAALARLTPLVP
jgi:hypothetical protein